MHFYIQGFLFRIHLMSLQSQPRAFLLRKYHFKKPANTELSVKWFFLYLEGYMYIVCHNFCIKCIQIHQFIFYVSRFCSNFLKPSVVVIWSGLSLNCDFHYFIHSEYIVISVKYFGFESGLQTKKSYQFDW